MKTWKVLHKGTNSAFEQQFDAKYFSAREGLVILHDGSPDNPVAILSIENFHHIKVEEELR